ncbi:hypothetical protein WN55_10533 [Dufourea novaeangliae]|uniref:Uncharacterized protein n=1 Tax=Dufourea novaeangliae TaxID=178035 RepID=A0A154P467_DUFNO|nr:hypothetical protein WN55_10533 [Dufourea novaeangliae]
MVIAGEQLTSTMPNVAQSQLTKIEPSPYRPAKRSTLPFSSQRTQIIRRGLAQKVPFETTTTTNPATPDTMLHRFRGGDD